MSNRSTARSRSPRKQPQHQPRTAADLYTSGDYYRDNPDFHAGDSPWKAEQVLRTLAGQVVPVRTVAEVGCGAGGVLAEIHDRMPHATLKGFDISPQAIAQARASHRKARLSFDVVGEKGIPEGSFFDLLLAVDVVEHVEDPFGFLRGLRAHCRHLVAHVPLALSVQTMLRPHVLMDSWRKLGHIHCFTEELALATVEASGFSVIRTVITAGGVDHPRGWKAKLARVPRALAYRMSPSRAAWLLGGFSIMILARS
jgi:SAM-dependent methyltransferase